MTAVVDEFREGIDAVLHPGSTTKKKMEIEDAFAMYYKFSIIPTVLAIIISLFSQAGELYAIVLAFVIWIGLPISILVNSALYQFFGKVLFKAFKNSYANSVTALVYGSFPVVLFYWLVSLVSLGGNLVTASLVLLILFIIAIWELFVTIVALANQQKCSRLTAFGVMIITGVVVAVILVFLVMISAAVLGPGTSPGPVGTSQAYPLG